MQKIAEVIKLDKGFPLICVENTQTIRAEFNSFLSKKHTAVAIGDRVRVTMPSDNPLKPKTYNLKPTDVDEPCIIQEILPRTTELLRNDPVNRQKEQVLAANFDAIALCVAAGQENFNHLARMLVIACNARVPVTLVFTKCDLAEPNLKVVSDITNVVSDIVKTSVSDIEAFKKVNNRKTTVLLGKSGVGKSTLINSLAGKNVCKQGDVRLYDSKGRHTTVSREIFDVGEFGRIVDMPGVRSLGLINCEHGLKTVFANIFELANECKFRNCSHTGEPGCAVADHVSDRMLKAYHELTAENKLNSHSWQP